MPNLWYTPKSLYKWRTRRREKMAGFKAIVLLFTALVATQAQFNSNQISRSGFSGNRPGDSGNRPRFSGNRPGFSGNRPGLTPGGLSPSRPGSSRGPGTPSPPITYRPTPPRPQTPRPTPPPPPPPQAPPPTTSKNQNWHNQVLISTVTWRLFKGGFVLCGAASCEICFVFL